MTDIILVAAVIIIIAFGYFAVARLDKFLNENRESIEKEKEKKEPSCVMLTEDMSEADMIEEINLFRSKHKNAKVIIYDTSDGEIPELSK